MAKAFGRDPEKLEFSVLLMGGADMLIADMMKQYQGAGVSHLVVAASAVSEEE